MDYNPALLFRSCSFNRTTLELKSNSNSLLSARLLTFNRTTLELKFLTQPYAITPAAAF